MISGIQKYRVRMLFTEQILGSLPADQSVFKTYIASKMATDKAAGSQGAQMTGTEIAARTDEEADAVARAGEREEQGWSIIPIDKEGNLIRWDYQIKGFFKGGWEAMSSAGSGKIPAGKSRIDKWLHVFADPTGKAKGRTIKYMIGEGDAARPCTPADVTLCERPLRSMTAQGPRVSLKRSDTLPSGTWIEFYIHILPLGIDALSVKVAELDQDDHENAEAESTEAPGKKKAKTKPKANVVKQSVEDTIKLWLDYGEYSGMGEWRNAGNGRFVYEIEKLG